MSTYSPIQIQEVFFDAMIKSYAGSRPAKKHELVDFPGSKHIEYISGIWRVTDTYETMPRSDFAFGTTRIYADNKLVWAMQYFGKYSREGARFLKWILGHQYHKRIFLGGRGPKETTYINTEYKNDCLGTFKLFTGREVITTKDGLVLGWHNYNGAMMH